MDLWNHQRVENGKGTTDIYPLFPGVELAVLDFRAERFIPKPRETKDIMEINFCLEGRAECKMKDGCVQFIGEGDIFLNTLYNHSKSIEMPLGFYRGITIIIDLLDNSIKESGELLGISLDIRELAKGFFEKDECFFIQAKENLRTLFSGAGFIPGSGKEAYYRLKVLELLLYLNYFEPREEVQKKIYTRQQIDTVKQIQKQMTRNVRSRYTIEDLSKEHCISPTALKTHFKAVYGKSIASYMKEYRIKTAEDLLRNTNKSISDIALLVGYESQSKFGAAFKERFKTTPLEYRKYMQQMGKPS